MSIYKRFKGRKLKNSKDPNWSKGTWYVYKRLNGRIIHRSIPEAQTKDDAEKAERKIIETVFNRRYGIAETVGFVEFANGPYTRYFQSANTNLAAKRLYVQRLCAAFKGKTLDAISPQDCRDIQAKLRKTTSDSSVNRIMSTLSKLFTLACEEGLLEHNPMQYVRMLKEPPKRKRLLTAREKDKLWKHLITSDTLLFRLVTLAVNLPLRRAQLLAITPDAIDFQNGLLLCTASKGRASRVIPINFVALNTLKDMTTDRQLPFPLKDFRKRWSRALIAAGINEKGGKRGENFTFHDLRKEFATQLIRNKVSPKVIQDLFAHSDMSMTDIYMQTELTDLQAAVNTLGATILQPTQENDGPPN